MKINKVFWIFGIVLEILPWFIFYFGSQYFLYFYIMRILS